MSALPDRPPRPERSDSDGQHAGHRERCHRRRPRRTATHEAAALDGRGSLLGIESFETTFAGYARLLTGCATSDTSTSSRSSPQVPTPPDGCATCASTTSGCSRSTNRHAHTRRRRRQERPDRRRDGRPLGARREGHTIPKRPTRSSNRSGFAHHASERRQGPQRGDGPALPADHHRAPAATRTARRASLDPRQGDAVSPAATRPQQDQAGDDPLPEALHRARRRHHRTNPTRSPAAPASSGKPPKARPLTSMGTSERGSATTERLDRSMAG